MQWITVTALFVGLFLILAISFASLPSATVGIPVRLAGVPLANAGDCRPVVVQVAQDGWVRLFGETLRQPQLPARLRQIFWTRSDRVVFVTATSDIPYEKAIAVMDAIVKNNYTIALLTLAVSRCCCPTVLGYDWVQERADRDLADNNFSFGVSVPGFTVLIMHRPSSCAGAPWFRNLLAAGSPMPTAAN